MKVEIQEGFDNVEVIIKCPKNTKEIHRIETLLHGFDQRLSCTKNGVINFIDKHDILYFESVDKNCFIYTKGNFYETSLKLYEIEEMLADMGFMRITKSQIVNIAKIEFLCPDFGGRIEIIMENDYKLVASRQYAKLLKKRMGLK
jgi:DNA-binding LytR/AlgR family response regulator